MPNKPNPNDIIWEKEIEWEPETKIAPQEPKPGFPYSIIPSAVEYGKSFVTAIESIPQMPAMALNLSRGLAEKAIPGTYPGYEAYPDAIWEHLKGRYGSWENIVNTMNTDPVGFAGDLASALIPGGWLFSKIGLLAKVGQTLSKAGKAIEPLNITAEIAKGGLWGLKKGVSPLLGVTTGKGTTALTKAFEGEKGFIKGIRGKIDPEDVLEESQSALGKMKIDRHDEYIGRFNKLGKLNITIDMNPIIQELGDQIKRYRIRFDNKGNIRRGSLDEREWPTIEKIIKKVNDWGGDPEDFTVLGMDELKRALDDFWSPSKNSEAFVESLAKKVKQTIIDKVPEYETMTKEYFYASKTLKKIEKGLSLGTQDSVNIAINKLISSINDNQEFRRGLIMKLEEAGGKELLDQLAGIYMKPLVPAGLIGRGMAAGIFTAVFGTKALAGLALTSPKLMGTLAYSLSKGVKEYRKITNITTVPRLMWLQTGRTIETQKGLVP